MILLTVLAPVVVASALTSWHSAITCGRTIVQQSTLFPLVPLYALLLFKLVFLIYDTARYMKVDGLPHANDGLFAVIDRLLSLATSVSYVYLVVTKLVTERYGGECYKHGNNNHITIIIYALLATSIAVYGAQHLPWHSNSV